MLIDEIIPYEKNARHNEKAIPVVADSIREFGLRGQIVLESRDNPVIVTGHTRVTAWAIEAGSRNPHLVTAYPRKRKG